MTATRSLEGFVRFVDGLIRLVLGRRGGATTMYVRLTLLLIGISTLAATGAFYVACLIAVHVSLVAYSLLGATASGHNLPPRADAAVVGGMTATLWCLLVVVLVEAFDGSAWPVGLLIGLPLGLISGWQVAQWQEAIAWSLAPGSLDLGMWRRGRFFVNRPFTVTAAGRLKHISVQGPTGSGKTTLLKNLIVDDIASGAGVCVIDPKDNLIDDLLAHVPPAREKDVILFDATDTEMPLAFNPLAGVSPERRSVATSELLAVFRRYFADSWGARLEHILRNAILALLELPQATLLDIPRLLLDRQFTAWALRYVSNPGVREFFEVEYEEVLRRRGDAVEPILNKVGPWLTYPELRGIIDRHESSFDLREVMDQGKVLLVRIPQGALGEDISSLLGALMVAKIQLAAHSRVDTPPERRRPFYLYVDEFQNFATSSFARILTEARGFGLGLVCANQYPEQLSRELQLALSRNAATAVQCLHSRGRYRLHITRLEEPRDEDAPPIVTPAGLLARGDWRQAERIRALSRAQYGRPQIEAEALIVAEGPHSNGSVPGRRARQQADVDEA